MNKEIKKEVKIRCLKCRKPFITRDKKTNRICKECNVVNRRITSGRAIRIGRGKKKPKRMII